MTAGWSNFILVLATLGGTLAVSQLGETRKPDHLMMPLESIPARIAGWTMSGSESLTTGVLEQLKPTSYLVRAYQKAGSQASLFIAYYAQQRAGESMHSPKHCLPGAGWNISSYGSAIVQAGPKSFIINKYKIENAGQRMLMFYWYQSRTRIIASEYMGKLRLVQDALFDGRTGGSIVRISLPDTPQSSEAGLAFASELIPDVQRCLGN